MSQKTFRQLLILVTIPLHMALFAQAQQEERWESVIEQVPDSLFPLAILDSAKKAHGVDFIKGMYPVSPKFSGMEEKLTFQISWGMIHAGVATVHSAPDPSDTTLLMVEGRGASNGFVSAFYKLRDQVRVVMDPAGLYPFYFEQHLREGRYRANRWTLYDQQKGIAYTNISKKDTILARPIAHNFLSLLWRLRAMPLMPGDTFSLTCVFNDRSMDIPFSVRRKYETINVETGSFRCVVIDPKLIGDGKVLNKKDNLTLWFSADSLHLPIMAKSKVAIGAVTAKLIWLEQIPIR